MPSPGHFPLFQPLQSRRPFDGEGATVRIVKVARLGPNARILDFGGSSAAVALAARPGCKVIAADVDAQVLDAVRERLQGQKLTDKVEVRRLPSLDGLPFGEGEFDGIIALGRVPFPLSKAVPSVRRHLAPKGRLCLTYPVKVGRQLSPAMAKFWEERLGEPLRSPTETMMLFVDAGYEPELTETLSDEELKEHYAGVEAALGKSSEAGALAADLKEELNLYRSQGERAQVSYGLFLARKRDPGEKPPASRDMG